MAREDSRYWEAFTDAQQEVVGALEGEAIGRALHGRLEPIFSRGRGIIQRHDIRLLGGLLKAWMPEKYR